MHTALHEAHDGWLLELFDLPTASSALGVLGKRFSRVAIDKSFAAELVRRHPTLTGPTVLIGIMPRNDESGERRELAIQRRGR